MTTIKVSYFISGDPEKEDKELPEMLIKALGMTFYTFVEITLAKVKDAIGGKCGKELLVKCYKGKSSGSCLKTIGMVVVAFDGDIKELEITLIHELLHLFQWDEKIIDAKAKEIYKGG